MKKVLIALFSTLLVSVGIAGCGSNDQQSAEKEVVKVQQPKEDTVKKEEKQAEVTPTGKTVEVTVRAKSFDFDVKEIKAHVGDTVKITLANDDGAHGLGIDAFNVDIKGGETKEFLADKTGSFDFYCSLMCGVGHDKMSGKLIVE